MEPPAFPDHDRLLKEGLVPASATVGVMAVAFALFSGALVVGEGLVLASWVTRMLTLSVVFVLPHLVVGGWYGWHRERSHLAPAMAGVAPVVVLVVALLAFGGPVRTPLTAPLMTIVAVSSWTTLFALGMVGAERVRERRSR